MHDKIHYNKKKNYALAKKKKKLKRKEKQNQ